MAITKILPVRGQLKGCLDYAANPQKTEYLSAANMQRLIHYTQNEDKTEHQLYVTGFNCVPQNAYKRMQATKRRWGKPLDSGNVVYHIIQSFKPGEATPDQVHNIGCEFARRFLADRFECTVSTHFGQGASAQSHCGEFGILYGRANVPQRFCNLLQGHSGSF